MKNLKFRFTPKPTFKQKENDKFKFCKNNNQIKNITETNFKYFDIYMDEKLILINFFYEGCFFGGEEWKEVISIFKFTIFVFDKGYVFGFDNKECQEWEELIPRMSFGFDKSGVF